MPKTSSDDAPADLEIRFLRDYTDSDRHWISRTLGSAGAIDTKIMERRVEVLSSETKNLPSYLAVPLRVFMKQILSRSKNGAIDADDFLMFIRKIESSNGLLTSALAIKNDNLRAKKKMILQIGALTIATLAFFYLLFLALFWYHATYGTWTVNYEQSPLWTWFGFK